MDFDGFLVIWCQKVPGPGREPKKRPVAPIETFAPSWLAGWLAGWLGLLPGLIFIDFSSFLRIWCHNAPTTWPLP